MKKWNTPEITELNINKTAAVADTCIHDESSPCYATGNGKGLCNNCKGNNPNGKKDYRIPENTGSGEGNWTDDLSS